MKLRNKKTGDICVLETDGEIALFELIRKSLDNDLQVWEEIKEPLIKDEKIRKAVRAVANITGVSMMFYRYIGDAESVVLSDFNGQILKFKSEELPIKQGKSYTIDELCGEEEE